MGKSGRRVRRKRPHFLNIQDACVECIINQSRRVAQAIDADETLSLELTSTVSEMTDSFNFKTSPPVVATPIYQAMANIAGKTDLYDEVKKNSTLKALEFVPSLKIKIANSSTPLLTSIKIAVAGNVIDLAAEVSFDLDEEIVKIFDTHFSIDDFELLKSKLESVQTLLYIGDNAGEHIFDYLCIESIQNLYPHLSVSYMTRGAPIINDVTYEEAVEAGFDKLCNLVDSGVKTPGFDYLSANKASQKLFDSVDVVITKGMGNYECLSPTHRKDLFYLLKVKCNVVASSLGREVGDIICKQNSISPN